MLFVIVRPGGCLLRCMVVLLWAAPSFPMPSTIKSIVAIAVSVGVCCGFLLLSIGGLAFCVSFLCGLVAVFCVAWRFCPVALPNWYELWPRKPPDPHGRPRHAIKASGRVPRLSALCNRAAWWLPFALHGGSAVGCPFLSNALNNQEHRRYCCLRRCLLRPGGRVHLRRRPYAS